jgi:hypothetical protein
VSNKSKSTALKRKSTINPQELIGNEPSKNASTIFNLSLTILRTKKKNDDA